MPRTLPLTAALLAALAAGCGSEPPAAAEPPPANTAAGDASSEFQPEACGTIKGAVTWGGPLPAVPPVTDIRPRPDGSGHDVRTLTHPYTPSLDRASFALKGAVVYLRNIPARRAKPWNHPPVRVEFRDAQIVVTQGDREPGRVGFVRRGDPVTFCSAEPTFNVLRARGAAFFAIPFPDRECPVEPRIDTFGRVELTSAAGFAWQAADLFVADHPYYALSGPDGRYEFKHVPDGVYELVVWHPNWNVTGHERNPETGLIQKVTYAPPLESVRPVMVVRGREVFANANLSLPK